MKKNKIRYTSQGNPYPRLTFSGKVFLKYVDEEAINRPAKGDACVFLSSDSPNHPAAKGEYEATGHAGFLKAAIFDGKRWQPFSIQEFFPGREHYYNKHERPVDTYALCRPLLEKHAGVSAQRTYREHYEPVWE